MNAAIRDCGVPMCKDRIAGGIAARMAALDAAVEHANKPALGRGGRGAQNEIRGFKPEIANQLTWTYRGEDSPKSGKTGRGPEEVRKAGGFKPWRFSTLEHTRTKLIELVDLGQLESEAQIWCEQKNQENGWFFSTAVRKEAAYDTYDHVYRLDVGNLVKRDWSKVGIPRLEKIESMHLYTDAESVNDSSHIAVIWDSPGRTEELLIMSPVRPDRIWVWKKAEGEDPGEWQHLPVWTAGSGS